MGAARVSQGLLNFFRHVDVSDQDGCWLWQAQLQPNGYGQFHWRGIKVMAHRFAHRVFYEQPLEGLVIDHLCRNPRCVRPDHLEAVTQRVNVRRGKSMLLASHCLRGHEFTSVNTYTITDSRGHLQRNCRKCGVLHSRSYQRRQKAIREAAVHGAPS